jgi:hypothetical protein
MLVKVGAKDTETVVNALIKHARELPQELYESLTWDRGKGMAGHKRFARATDIQVYFCDPRSPWQRGSNENTNDGTCRSDRGKTHHGTHWRTKNDARLPPARKCHDKRAEQPIAAGDPRLTRTIDSTQSDSRH